MFRPEYLTVSREGRSKLLTVMSGQSPNLKSRYNNRTGTIDIFTKRL